MTRNDEEGSIELTVTCPGLPAPRVYAYPLTDTLRQFFTELGACLPVLGCTAAVALARRGLVR